MSVDTVMPTDDDVAEGFRFLCLSCRYREHLRLRTQLAKDLISAFVMQVS